MEHLKKNEKTEFQSINRGYNEVFRAHRLSIGLTVPIENYPASPVPEMHRHVERVQLAESLGFSSVWLRDVPLNVPSFGDAGQMFDPFVYLGLLAGQTKRIALGVASIILPLRHPAHVAKAASTADVLSGGRLILGVASGDRPDEYPALNMPYEERGERFRASYDYIREISQPWPEFDNLFGRGDGKSDMLPKPVAGKLPLVITGGSQQSPDWLAQFGDGWMLYPRPAKIQSQIIKSWRGRLKAAGRSNQPAMEPLYIDLTKHSVNPPQPIHLGLRLGVSQLLEYLKAREEIGVNHVALNLRFNQADVEDTMKRLADEVLPAFSF